MKLSPDDLRHPSPPAGAVQGHPTAAQGHGRPAAPQRRRGLLVAAVCALVLLAAVGAAAFHFSNVLSFAELAESTRIERDRAQPNRLTIAYRPKSGGRVELHRAANGRDEELIEQASPAADGAEQKLAWDCDGVNAGERITVRYRKDWSLATEELVVPDLPPAVATSKKVGAVKPAEHATDAEKPKPATGEEKATMAKSEPRAVPAEKSGEPVAAPAETLGLYSVRTLPNRALVVSQYGGTPESEAAVADGLNWLARHQATDGHWGPDCLGAGADSRCEKQHPCSGPGQPFEAALTGLAVLAFQAGGHYDFNQHKYSDTVVRGLNALVEQQGAEGQLVGSLNDLADGSPGTLSHYDQRFMYEHAIGTFALCEACAVAKASGREPNPKYLQAASKAVRFIEDQQHDDGGWRYSVVRQQPSDCSVSGWVMLALKTALEAGIEVKSETIQRMTVFFAKHSDSETGRTQYQIGNYVTDAMTGVGMMVDEFVEHRPNTPLVEHAASYLAEQAEREWKAQAGVTASDYYLWYNCTMAMFQAGGEPWQRWNKVVRDHVIGLQVHGSGCERGSWEPNDRWGSYGGRIYSTALATLTLEVYYRFAKQGDGKDSAAAQKTEKPAAAP